MVWESYPCCVQDCLELCVFGGLLWGVLGRGGGRKSGGLVWVSVQEVRFFFVIVSFISYHFQQGLLNWSDDPLLPSPFSLCLQSPASPSHTHSCTFLHITSFYFSPKKEKKIVILYGTEGRMELKEGEEEGGREGGKLWSLYLIIQRIFLSSLLSIFHSPSPYPSPSSPSFSSSLVPNHLFPLASTTILNQNERVGIVKMKETEVFFLFNFFFYFVFNFQYNI